MGKKNQITSDEDLRGINIYKQFGSKEIDVSFQRKEYQFDFKIA